MAEEETTPPQDAPAQAKPRKGLALIIAVVAVVLGGGIGARMVGPSIVKRSTAEAASHDSALAADKKAGDPGVMHVIENLVLNPAGTGGTRFLMVSVAIETRNAATNEEMNNRDAEVRDLTLRLLGGKTVEQLADVTQRDALRQELKNRLGKLFEPGAIRQIYFPQFVIQ